MTVNSSYGVFVVGESMSPAYEQGDIALVHPGLPPRRGADVILSRREPDGTPHVLIKQLVGWTDTEWRVRQYNPAREFELPRDEWTEVQTIVGVITRDKVDSFSCHCERSEAIQTCRRTTSLDCFAALAMT